MPPTLNSSSCVWTLSAQSNDVASIGELTILASPFRVGRKPNLELSISQEIVSGLHATLYERDEKLLVEDSGSRNGTFVNGTQIEGAVEVFPGDVIQFAKAVFRVSRQSLDEEDYCETIGHVAAYLGDAQQVIEFEQMMDHHLFDPNLQSVVDLNTLETTGFEVLVRGRLPELHSAGSIFQAAEKMQRAGDLSELIRTLAMEQFEASRAQIKASGKKLFLNTHPSELANVPRLIRSLEAGKANHPTLELVLEIHESAITDMQEMFDLCGAIKALGYEFAYDDFGAGQARFFELIEEPPTYLKFDIRLVKDLHLASPRRRKAIESLVQMVKNLDIICIAEGVEVQEDAAVCRDIGFEMAQGYYYSRPQPISAWISQSE